VNVSSATLPHGADHHCMGRNGSVLTRSIPSDIFETVKVVRDSRDGGCDDGVIQGDAQGSDA
jgi:hypothetical protein